MKLTPAQYQRVDQGLKAVHEGAADPQTSAKERLRGMAVDMVDKKGNIKSGYVKLVNDGDNQLRLGTRWSKKADTSTKDALSYVRDLVSQAYGEDSPAMAAITQYTQAKGDRIGTHSFVKLVRDLEAVNPEGNSRVDRLLNARVKGDATMQTDAFAAHPMQEMLLEQLNNQPLAEAQEVLPDAPEQAPIPAPADAPVAAAPHPMLALAPYQAPITAISAYKIPAAAVPQTPQAKALNFIGQGQYDLAIHELCTIEPRPSPTELANFLVNQHLQGRPITAQLVQFARAMDKQGSFSAADLAEFAFQAVKLPHGDEVSAPDFDASRLEGLVGFCQLLRAGQTGQKSSLSIELAERLEGELSGSPSCQALSNTLRSLSEAPSLSLTDMVEKLRTLYEEYQADVYSLDRSEKKLRDKTYANDVNVLLEGWSNTIKERIDSGSPVVFLQDTSIDDEDSRYVGQLTKKISEIATKKNVKFSGMNLPGLPSKISLSNSSFEDIQFTANLSDSELSNCIISGMVSPERLYGFVNSNVTGSDITLKANGWARMLSNFRNATLTDATIRFDFSDISRRLGMIRETGHDEVLAFQFNHLDPDFPGRGPLSAIKTIDDKYPELKIKLMKQTLEFVNQYSGLRGLEPAFVDVLSSSPIYLEDARIRQLVAPMLPTLQDTILGELSVSNPQKFLSLSFEMMEPAMGEASPEVNDYIRQNFSRINSLLFQAERKPQLLTTDTAAKAQLLRQRLNELPEIKPIAAMLDSLYLEYERADGQTVEMPFYFEFNNEGVIAALTAVQFGKVSEQSSKTKLIEDTMFFVPPGLRYGTAGTQYITIDNSEHVLLSSAHINNVGTPLLLSFPLLGEAYKAATPTPAMAVSDHIFAGDETLHRWVSDAYKGVGRRLSENEITYLQNQFGQSAAGLFTAFDHANNPARWPQSGLAPQFERSLRELAQQQGVSADNDAGFAHFLFAQSAALTRLSSEKIFGDGNNSIPPLRFAGYVLFSRARQLAPELLTHDRWQDLENRFLKLENAMDCAEVLSRVQFSQSKAANLEEFERFTPAIFKSLG